MQSKDARSTTSWFSFMWKICFSFILIWAESGGDELRNSGCKPLVGGCKRVDSFLVSPMI